MTHDPKTILALAALINTSAEIWRPIPGYETNYLISSLGRVWSTPRPRTAGGFRKPSLDKYGYPKLSLCGFGRERTFKVHVLVALAFFGPRPSGMQIRHLDGDVANPSASNLAYGTPSENGLDSVRHGTNIWSKRTHCRQGHEYTPDNIMWCGTRRQCRICKRETSRRNHLRRTGRAA